MNEGLPTRWAIGRAVAVVDPMRRLDDGGIHWMPKAFFAAWTFSAELSRAEACDYLIYEDARALAQCWARTLNEIYGEV